jgi:hypothetical protein
MGWDQIFVYLIVAAAAAYLAWRNFGRRSKGSCGGCNACPGASTAPKAEPPASPLVQLELKPPPRRQ